MVTEANTKICGHGPAGGYNGWGRSVQGHESAELDAEMAGGKVVSLMVGLFTGQEKPALCWCSTQLGVKSNYIHVYASPDIRPARGTY